MISLPASSQPIHTTRRRASDERTNLEIVDGICAALEAIRPAAGNPALAARGVKRYGDLRTFVADRPGHDRRYAVDATRLTTELGWRPANRFEDGIRSTVVRHRPRGEVRPGAPRPGGGVALASLNRPRGRPRYGPKHTF